MSPLWQLTLWRTREFLREPEAVFWVFAFPIILSLALGIAFKNRAPDNVKVAIPAGAGAAELKAALDANGGKKLETLVLDSAEAYNRLRTGGVSLLVIPGEPVTLRYDSTRQESDIARLVVASALQEAGGRRDVRTIGEVRVTEPGSRYIDFLIPGLLGMNIMGTGLWGIGFGLVSARQRKLLKRFLATPMRKSNFMLAFMLSRLVFLTLEVVSVVVFAWAVFSIPVRGSVLAIAGVVLLGATSFAGVGLLVASRARTIEGVSGLMNLVMMPMWICSGVFFSWSRFPEAVQPFIRLLPLTALNDALRAVMIDGESLVGVAGLLGVVATWGLVTFGVAFKIFRWN
ncbi:MAG: ABC transporter permease [Gemmatimonadetes bacterium]|nr:ABC transporter permease [Gemmatimonadota bacterium]